MNDGFSDASKRLSATAAVDVSVCIVTANQLGLLRACLRSLHRCTVGMEVIAVANGSSEEVVLEIERGFPEVRLIVLRPGTSFSAANNHAIFAGCGKYFFILNDDTELIEGCIEAMTKFLDEHPTVGIVAGQMLNPDGTLQVKYYPRYLPTISSLVREICLPLHAHVANRKDLEHLSQMEQVPGACMLIRKEVFGAVGLFDEQFQFWYEDVDICRRTLDAGWEIWHLPEARLYHYGGASFGRMLFSDRSLLRFRSLLHYTRKHFSPMKAGLAWLLVLVTLIARLPIVAVLELSPARARYKGATLSYLTLLREMF